MAVSFISRMGEVTGEKKYFDDAANQILNYTRYLWCPENRFIIIAIIRIIKSMEWRIGRGPMDGFYGDSRFAGQNAGRSPHAWWCDKEFPDAGQWGSPVSRENGLWHQLLDKADSYEEITGTSMFVFGIAKGVKEGWLHPDFIYVAWQGLKVCCQRFQRMVMWRPFVSVQVSCLPPYFIIIVLLRKWSDGWRACVTCFGRNDWCT